MRPWPEPSTEIALPTLADAMAAVDDAAEELEAAQRRYLDAVIALRRHPRLARLGLELIEVESEFVESTEVIP